MATYPLNSVLPQLEGTFVIGDDGKVVNVTTSGKPRVRTYYSQTLRRINIVHDLTQTQLDTLMAFYTTNADITFDFVYIIDGVTYTCLFTGHPKYTPRVGERYDVTVEAIEA